MCLQFALIDRHPIYPHFMVDKKNTLFKEIMIK